VSPLSTTVRGGWLTRERGGDSAGDSASAGE